MRWMRSNLKLLLLISLLAIPILGALLGRNQSGDMAVLALGVLIAYMLLAVLKA